MSRHDQHRGWDGGVGCVFRPRQNNSANERGKLQLISQGSQPGKRKVTHITQHGKGYLIDGRDIREASDSAKSTSSCMTTTSPYWTHTPPAQQIHRGDQHKPTRKTNEQNDMKFPDTFCSFFLPWVKNTRRDLRLRAELSFSLCLKRARMQKLTYLEFPF